MKVKNIKIKDNYVQKFFIKHPTVFEKLKIKKIDLFYSKMKGTNLLKIRIKNKYRILFLLHHNDMYIFDVNNRDRIYNNKKWKEFKIDDYNWTKINI